MLVVSPPSKEFSQVVEGLVLEYLESNLKKWEIPKSALYITPFVKCRTKSPTKKSIETCYKWLRAEIELFQPKAVIIIGNHNQIKLVDAIDNKCVRVSIPHSLYELATNSGTKYATDTLFSTIRKYIELQAV